MNPIQQFYSQNPFPGLYTIEQLDSFAAPPSNRYLRMIDQYLQGCHTVLDVGCGTGLITNLFARRYSAQFTGVDFSDSIDYAQQFAQTHSITNVTFVKQDLLDFDPGQQYQTIICQSVINHVPEYQVAIQRLIQWLSDDGILLLGVYNPYAKYLKPFVNYNDRRLQLDQTQNPFEISFTRQQTVKLCNPLTVKQIMPSVANRLVDASAVFNSRNHGLTMYAFHKGRP
jgi:2-polyprenyl-3-methyl-5-hydroxy-6-metoxy-1,4-benzoquinol methylase